MQVISAHMYPMTTLHIIMLKGRRGAVGCTRNVEVVGSSPIKGPRCFIEQETLPLLLSSGWLQNRNSSVISQSN